MAASRMPFDPTHLPPLLLLFITLAGAAVVLTWRFRETAAPVTLKSLVAPPLGMATGFFMFIEPHMRVPLEWALGALALGALVFAEPLARSSRLTREGDRFMMKRSRAFLWILLGLLAARFALRQWLEQYVSQLQTGALFYLLAFGAIARWRVQLVLEYRRLSATSAA